MGDLKENMFDPKKINDIFNILIHQGYTRFYYIVFQVGDYMSATYSCAKDRYLNHQELIGVARDRIPKGVRDKLHDDAVILITYFRVMEGKEAQEFFDLDDKLGYDPCKKDGGENTMVGLFSTLN